eukprot:978560_1
MATTTTVGEADLSHSDNNCKYEPYCFCGKSADSVLLYHSYNKYIRSNPNSTVQVSGHGGTSRFAQWKLHAMSNDVFKLQNVHTRKYLRIINNGKTVDVGGTGGKYTLFRAIQSQHHDTSSRRCEPHQISLQSVQFPEYYIAANGQCTVYSFHMNHAQTQSQNDINLYLHIRRLQMRCTQEQKDDALYRRMHSNQALSSFNMFNPKSGKYLRIINNGNEYTVFKYNPTYKTLESNKFAGYFLAINKKSQVFAVHKATAIQNAAAYLYAFNIKHLNVPSRDHGTGRGIVVVQHGFGKSLRVKPGNECEVNGNGGRGQFARWNVEYFDHKSKVKLRSTKSRKYLRIIQNGKKVDVGGGGGVFTLFKYDPVDKTLESNRFKGCFLAVQQANNTVIAVNNASKSDAICTRFVLIAVNGQRSVRMKDQMDQGAMIQSQKELIEQQKRFIDQLQATIQRQQRIIDNLSANRNESGSHTNDAGEGDDDDDGFQYVSSPGAFKK